MTASNRHGLMLGRRRFIAIAAAIAGSGVLPRLSAAHEARTFSWRGVALGAEATLTLQHYDEAEAKSAIDACLAEVARLEAIFSLHRPDSALVRLNREGALLEAPADLRILLSEAIALAARTDGAFDPTVQPLWALYALHFSSGKSDAKRPSQTAIKEALGRVGWRRVALDAGGIKLLGSGMSLTLNGIAQGYITDKVGELLRARGFRHVLVNMGEQLALGPKWDGSAWQVGIQDPHDPNGLIGRLSLDGGAVATSGRYCCNSELPGLSSHILDPRTGEPASRFASVSVLAERATCADGLSTVLSLLPVGMWQSLLGTTSRAYAVEAGSHTGYWV